MTTGPSHGRARLGPAETELMRWENPARAAGGCAGAASVTASEEVHVGVELRLQLRVHAAVLGAPPVAAAAAARGRRRRFLGEAAPRRPQTSMLARRLLRDFGAPGRGGGELSRRRMGGKINQSAARVGGALCVVGVLGGVEVVTQLN